MRTEMNLLALSNCVLVKEQQPAWHEGQAEGLESEDVSKSERSGHPKALIRSLKKLLRRRFLPIAASLLQQDVVLRDQIFRRSTSEWTTVNESMTVKEIFDFPQELYTPAPDCKRLAQALTIHWKPGPSREALLPLVEELVELGLRQKAEEALENDNC